MSNKHLYVGPGPHDSRSPCPALNALANHSYIPHDGRRLTVSILVEAFQRIYNLSMPLAFILSVAGILLCGNGRSFDLEQLAKHNILEHDGSLSRKDYSVLPFHSYSPVAADPYLVEQLFDQSADKLYLTLEDFASARVLRDAAILGPGLNFFHAELARGEVSMILQVFGGDSGRVANDIFRAWLVDGQLSDGWKRPDKVAGTLRTILLSRRLAAAMKRLRRGTTAE